MQALVTPAARRVVRDVVAEELDRTGRRARVLARQRGHQFLLAVARHAGNAEDLAGAHLQADAFQIGAERRLLLQRQLAQLEHHVAEPGLHVLQLQRLGADHQARQAGVGLAGRVDLAGDLAGAQHGAVVAQRADLVELVADVENAGAGLCQLAQRHEERLHRLGREHRRGFVQDQQLRLGQQGAHDLDALTLADRQCVHRPLRIDVEAIKPRHQTDAAGHLGQRGLAVEAEPDVLGHGERVEQAEVLEHHADAEFARLRRAGHLHRLAVPADLAFVGPHGAVNNLHQRRLAGAVFTQHGMDLAWRDLQVDAVVRLHRRILLADVDEFEA